MSTHAQLDTLGLQPWFHDALNRVGLQKGARVVMLTASIPDLCWQVLQTVGKDGHLTVIEPDAERAARANLIDHPNLAVIAYQPDGDEHFGRHDALIACPAIDPGWPLNRWSEFARGNLRPGGHFVIDLPAERHCEPISTAWAEIHGPADKLQAWNGPSDTALTRVLNSDHLREIDAGVAGYVVEFTSPHDAAAVACERLEASEEVLTGLHLTLARRFATQDHLELLFRRTHAAGMR